MYTKFHPIKYIHNIISTSRNAWVAWQQFIIHQAVSGKILETWNSING